MKNNNLESGLSILLIKSEEKRSLSVHEILTILSGKGQLLILVILSLPFGLPLPLPGFSSLFGILIALIGIRMAFGRKAWIPKSILHKHISSKTLQRISHTLLKLLNWLRFLIHPRLTWLCVYKASRIFHGILVAILGVLLAIPIFIPLTNFFPAWSIFFMSIGLLENDGLFVIFGYILSLTAFFYFLFLAWTMAFALQ